MNEEEFTNMLISILEKKVKKLDTEERDNIKSKGRFRETGLDRNDLEELEQLDGRIAGTQELIKVLKVYSGDLA